MAGVILNDVLCYLASARNTLTVVHSVQNSAAFFTDDVIVRAKQKLYEICKEKFAARKACTSYPYVYTRHVEHILDLSTSKEGSSAAVPTFATSSFDSKPTTGFESIALCSSYYGMKFQL